MEGYVVNIEDETLDNKYYRKVLFTSDYQQLVIMNLRAGQEIGGEIHEDIDQFIRIEKGVGTAHIGEYTYDLEDGISINIPRGVYHNIINTSSYESLQLYTIYSPPEHPPGRVDRYKPRE